MCQREYRCDARLLKALQSMVVSNVNNADLAKNHTGAQECVVHSLRNTMMLDGGEADDSPLQLYVDRVDELLRMMDAADEETFKVGESLKWGSEGRDFCRTRAIRCITILSW